MLVRKQKWLPEVEEDTCDAIPKKARGKWKEIVAPDASEQRKPERPFRRMSPTLRRRGSPSTTAAETYSQASRANRYSRYEAVRRLHQQALSQRAIARRLKISRQTIRRFLRAESFPERSTPAKKASILDPYGKCPTKWTDLARKRKTLPSTLNTGTKFPRKTAFHQVSFSQNL